MLREPLCESAVLNAAWEAANRTMNPQVFREYDIRGVVERDFNDAFVTDLGRAWGTMLVRAGARTVTVGRDCRLSSEHLRDLLVDGATECGINVIDVGVVPTPLLYFSVLHWQMDGGGMITGSHNAAEYNGFKLGVGNSTIFGEKIQELRKLIERRDFVRSIARGTVTSRPVVPDYRDFILANFTFMHRFKVIVDGGNGCGGAIAAPLMEALGLEVKGLHIEMDGRFPAHHPDPTVVENMRDLIDAMKREKAAVGIAYDGDADRIGAVDENGRIVWGDELMVIYSRGILAKRSGATIIGDVKCSDRLYEDVRRHGGRPIMWKTGHSLIKSKLREEGAALAGEMSGHMFFADRYYGFDDAIYASFRLLEIIDGHGGGLGSLIADLPVTAATPEIRVECSDERKFEVVRKAGEYFRANHEVIDIDGVRVRFPGGWGLVRASNTQPALVLRFEARDEATLREIQSQFTSRLRELGVEADG
jgi:phosphomannomutase/phosphoglucomutase